jgi:hypothetical protein
VRRLVRRLERRLERRLVRRLGHRNRQPMNLLFQQKGQI